MRIALSLCRPAALAALVSCLLALPSPSSAQPSASQAEPFAILDNSFLVEEAFNQESGIFQNIFGFQAQDDAWEFAFTQEWPVRSQLHQLSYTIGAAHLGDESGIGDVMVNYRYQLWMESDTRPAFSPRVSVILPSGDDERGLGEGHVGWQVNLPFSKQHGDFYLHANGGFTSVPGDDSFVPHLSGSAIFRARPMLHPMLEVVLEFDDEVATTISPGVRGGWNLGDRQLILGAALPILRTAGTTDAGVLLYLSYELPFAR